MRIVWLVFAGLLVLLALVLPRLNRSAPGLAAAGLPAPPAAPAVAVAAVVTSTGAARALLRGPAARADSVAAFGLAQRGTPYAWAGTSPLTGFDCSGFIMYTFARFGVAVPHSTALLIGVGRPVPRAGAAPGDIVVFTGTDTSSTTPGHAGIVVSGRGEVPLRFVHASSARRESGVKVSAVEGTGYERRFMQVRRVLGPKTAAIGTSSPPPAGQVARPAAVAAVAARPVAVEPRGARAKGLPSTLATRRRSPLARTTTANRRKATAAKKKPSKAVISKKKRTTPTPKKRTPAKATPRKRAAR